MSSKNYVIAKITSEEGEIFEMECASSMKTITEMTFNGKKSEVIKDYIRACNCFVE